MMFNVLPLVVPRASWLDDTGDINTDKSKRDLIVTRALRSNRKKTDVGYEQAMLKRIEDFPESNIKFSQPIFPSTYCFLPQKECNQRVTITIPAWGDYRLPLGGTETITAGPISNLVIDWPADTSIFYGEFSVDIASRTVVYTGSFFSAVTTCIH